MNRIVLVDDEPDVLESTAMVLEMNGFEVVAVNSAPDIMDSLMRVRPDILLQDVYMPGLNLEALIKAIRAQPDLRSMRVLVFTASTEAEDITRKLGADGYVRKPFEASRIKQILTRHLAGVAGGAR